MKVLLLEDDVQLNFAICTYLNTVLNNDVDTFVDGEEVINIIEIRNYDLFILDINVPNINGLDILSYIRKTNINVPILIITASLEIKNFAKAFEYGCNEYIKKPFHLKELEIRINNLIGNNEEVIHINSEIKYSKTKNLVFFKGEKINLRKKELRFFELMAMNMNKVVTYDEIGDYVWENEIKEDYPIRQLVNSIRRKIPDNFITTVFGQGYKIEN